MPDFNLPEGVASLTLRFLRGQEAREKTVPRSACANSSTLEFVWGYLAPVPPTVVDGPPSPPAALTPA